MPRQSALAVENNFSGGRVSEATGMNFPENACVDEDNCVFDELGHATRRLGFDFEVGFTSQSLNISNKVITSYEWNTVAGDGNLKFVVIQIGRFLHFYRVKDTGALSGGRHSTTIDLATFRSPGAPAANSLEECQFASGKGNLFVANEHLEPFYVEYDISADSFTATQITIKTRDFAGVDDSLDIDEEPTNLTRRHEYNLRNQGWQQVDNPGEARNTWAYKIWKKRFGTWPSNKEIWWLYKDAFETFHPWQDVGGLATNLKKNIGLGNTQAPQGHYILNEFYQDRSALLTDSEANVNNSIAVVSAGAARPSTVAHFAGRVWFAGVQAQEYTSKVYFSQIAEHNTQLGKCYQKEDPTSEHSSDLLPDDGGVLKILDAGTIYKLAPFGSALIAIANNGVWAISGSQGVGFKADDYSIDRISDIGAISNTSIVMVDGRPMWWNADGIWTVSGGGVEGVKVSSVSDKNIRTYFRTIPMVSKATARGAFNSLTKIVQWLFRSTEETSIADRYEFDKILNLNTLTGAFYTWTIPDHDVKVRGIVCPGGVVTDISSLDVVDSNDVAVTVGGVTLTVQGKAKTSRTRTFMYLTTYPTTPTSQARVTFSEARRTSNLDWVAYDGVGQSYTSYFDSGYKVHGEGVRKFQSNYLTVFCDNRSFRSSFDIFSKWDYASSGNTGKWSQTQRVQTTGNLHDYKTTRLKMRGHGKALQFRISSVAEEPFDIVGWVGWETANASP